MKVIGVFGANGFIGKHLVRRLAGNGKTVRAVSRRFDSEFVSELDHTVEFVISDFGDSIAMASALQGVDVVVQLISTSSPGLQNNYVIHDIEENVTPHVEFLQNCVHVGVRRYIFISSGGTIYGPGSDPPFKETHPTNPICSHGLTKLMVEKYLRMYGFLEGMQYGILRLSNPFGPGQEFHKGQGLIPVILSCLRSGRPIKIYGDGLARRDYIYIDDVIDAIEMAVISDAIDQTVLNIGSGETRSVIEVLDAVETVANRKIEREFIGARKTDVAVSSLDISQARQLIGWRPRVSFNEGIRKTLEHERT